MWYTKRNKPNPIYYMKKNSIRCAGIVLVALAVLLPGAGRAFAQQAQTAPTVIRVATVNIYDARIVAQTAGELKISFDLNNREGVQPNVKYAVALVQKTDAATTMVDQKVYDESVTLGVGETRHIDVTYMIPAFAKGTFDVMVYARNMDSTPLSVASVGQVALKGGATPIVMNAADCYLTVKEDAQAKKYDLSQGVDVDSTETLMIHCPAKIAGAVEATPVVETYFRTMFGRMVGNEKLPSMRVTDPVALVVPKAKDPQAYDGVLYFTDAAGTQIANKVIFHYVIRGVSATVQNAVADKASYGAGMTARVNIAMVPRADDFPGARKSGIKKAGEVVKAQLVDKSGNPCSNMVTAKDETVQSIDIPVTSACDGAQTVVIVDDMNGVMIGANAAAAMLKGGLAAGAGQPEGMGTKGGWILWTIVAIAIIGGAATVFIRRKKGASQIVMLLLIVGAGMVSANTAKADTFVARNVDPASAAHYVDVVFTVGLNKAVYKPKENIVASGSIEYGVCSNGVRGIDTTNTLSATINGRTKNILATMDSISSSTIVVSLGGNHGGSKIFRAQNEAGVYDAIFTGMSRLWNWSANSVAVTVPYKVVGPNILELSAPSSVEMPTPVAVSWRVEDSERCVASDAWSGDKDVSAGQHTETIWNPTTIAQRGSHTFALTCMKDVNSTTKAVTTKVLQMPRCSQFTANPTTIVPPQTAKLTWSCDYATSCSIDNGIGSVSRAGGSLTVAPTATTDYTLTCIGPDGSRSYHATVGNTVNVKIKEINP